MSEEFFLTEKGVKVLKWERNVFYQTPGIRELFYKENEVLLKNAGENSVILDIGCGLGTHLKLLSRHCKEVVGIDHSAAVLKHCRQEAAGLANAKVFEMNAKKLEFPDNCFDQTSCMFNTLGNLVDPLPVLREMCRVTKKSGKIIFSVYKNSSTPERLDFYRKTGLPDAIATAGEVTALGGKFYSRSYSEGEIQKMCEQVGLVEVAMNNTKLAYVVEAVKK